MDKKYIEACKNFTWLQENFKNYDSGKPNNGQAYVDDVFVQVPSFETLIRLLGMEEFTKVCANVMCLTFDELKLECLYALKRIKKMDKQVTMKDKAKHIRDGLLAAFCNAGGYVIKEGLNTEQLGNLQEAINFLAEIGGKGEK